MKELEWISIRGARVHNLKNVDVDLPLNQITCLSGPSGSGKTSLAFHTLYSESKRRYLNSFPSYLKFFLDRPQPADVDKIFPVLPAFGLPQNNPVIGSRSVVADVMGVTEKVQNLFYALGENCCPLHLVPLVDQSNLGRAVLRLKELGVKEKDVVHVLLPKDEYLNLFSREVLPMRSYNEKKGEMRLFDESDAYYEVFKFIFKEGPKVNNEGPNLEERLQKSQLTNSNIPFYFFHPLLKGPSKSKIKKLLVWRWEHGKECPVPDCTVHEGRKLELGELSPYNPLGACNHCQGHGANLVYDRHKIVPNRDKTLSEDAVVVLTHSRFRLFAPHFKKELKKLGVPLDVPFKKLPEKVWTYLMEGVGSFPGLNELLTYLEGKKYKKDVRIYLRGLQTEVICQACEGSRIDERAHYLRLGNLFYKDVYKKKIQEIYQELADFSQENKMKKKGEKEAKEYAFSLLKKLLDVLQVSGELGLGHLVLQRKTKTLSPGEYQRLLLLKYLSFEGTGGLFVFDEPSLGLGEKEQKKLFKQFRRIQQQGNTIILIDHSECLQNLADELILLGPGAGEAGGKIIFQRSKARGKSPVELGIFPTANLDDLLKSEFKDLTKTMGQIASGKGATKWVKVEEATLYDLPLQNFKLPLHHLTWVDGEAGSGKTAYVLKVLANHLYEKCHGVAYYGERGAVSRIQVEEAFADVLIFELDGGRSNSRSTVGTQNGILPHLRKCFSQLPVSKALGLKDGHFSANSPLGQCPSCEGKGAKIIDTYFFEDVILPCLDCEEMGIRKHVLHLTDGHFTFKDYLTLPLSQVITTLPLTPKMRRMWEYIKVLNLGHLSLNRTLPSLSGGERQRMRLLASLKSEVKNSFLFFENISFGLGRFEMANLVLFLHRLLSNQNTIVVIDKNPLFAQYSHFHLSFPLPS